MISGQMMTSLQMAMNSLLASFKRLKDNNQGIKDHEVNSIIIQVYDLKNEIEFLIQKQSEKGTD